MLSWLKRRVPAHAQDAPTPVSEPVAPQAHGMSQAFLALHKYLANRYSDVVVLTFGEVEDLLDSPLPAPARQDPAWWHSNDHQNVAHSNSWRLANRTAVANLVAQTVTFARV
jgi:hypothetical protein